MKKALWIIVGVILISIIGYRVYDAFQTKEAIKDQAAGRQVIPVDTGFPIWGEVVDRILQTGTITAQSEVTLYSKVPGKLVKNLVEMNDGVAPSQVVALVDRDEVGYEYNQYEVKSNSRGTVARVFLNPGAVVNATTPLCLIVDIDVVKAMVPVPEDQIRFVSVGKTATVTAQAYPGQEFRGKVTNVSPIANPVDRTIEVEISTANPQHALKPGMFVQAELVLGRRKAMLIPLAAVTEREGKRAVFLAQDSVAVLRPITTGSATNDSIVVTGGIRLSDRIIVAGTHLLNDGDRISYPLQ